MVSIRIWYSFFRAHGLAARHRLLQVCYWSLLSTVLMGQPPPGVNTQTQVEDPLQLERPDTFAFYYHLPQQPEEETLFADTLLGQFQQYDPIRQRAFDYTHLGNLGSAHYSLMFESRFRRGFQIGFDAYDLYQFEPEDLQFYSLRQAFTDVYFSQGPSQQDNYFKGRFARNFNKGIQFSLDYKRINSEGSYKQEAAQATALNVGLEYRPSDSRYESYLTFTSNATNQEHNGGVDTARVNDTNRDNTFNVPVFLEGHNTVTQHSNRTFSYLQYYRLLGKPGEPRQKPQTDIQLKNELRYRTARYKYFDEDPEIDDSFYGSLLTDQRGLRYYIEHRALDVDVALRLNRPRVRGGRKVVDQLEAGLRYTWHRVEQEPVDSTIHNLFIYGNAQFDLTKRISLRAKAHFGLLAQATDYRLEGTLRIDYAPWGILQVGAQSQRYTPPLIQARHFITQEAVWNNQFVKPIENQVNASLTIPKINLTLHGSYHLLTNFIYFDTTASPRQEDGVINVLQLRLEHKLRWRALGFESNIGVQAISGNAISLPRLFGKHSLWLEGKIFGNAMLSRLGVDVRYHNPYRANAFMPAITQFHLQEEGDIPFTPLLDAFFSFKVRSFRFMVKLEGLNNYWTDGFIYSTYRHPYPYAYFRFGVRWMFLD